MKKIFLIIVLLIFLLTSCKRSTAKDYYRQIQISQQINDEISLKDNVLLYMLSYNERNDAQTRDEVVRLYCGYSHSDTLNTYLLRSSDVLEGRITLYRSYAALGQYQNASEIIETGIRGYLPTKDLLTLMINYPISSDYTFSYFTQWQSILRESDYDDFTLLLEKFVRTDVSEKTLKDIFDLAEDLSKEEYFSNNTMMLSRVYKIMAVSLEKLHDNYNSNLYWKTVLNLNPQDNEAGNKVNG